MSSKDRNTAQSSKSFSDKDLETIKSLENEQSNFKKLVATSKQYSETEKAAVDLNTVADFDAFWRKANDAKDDFEKAHEQGCGLWSKRYQNSATEVQSFMQDFSPIIEIVKNFAAPYGGLAVGTISVLFAVAGNKNDLEDSLASTISAIQDRLPGLNLYQHIYNDKHELDMRLQARIVSAYQNFIEFCIEASKYYKRGGPRRWLKALGRPNSILDKAKKVQAVIVDIRRLCDELLDKNVHLIRQLNEDQKETIQGLEDQIKLLLRAQDDNTLTGVQQLLNLPNFSTEDQHKQLEQYHEELESDEQLNADYFEQMRGPRFELFKAGKDYQSWINAEHPCLLILSGYNNQSTSHIDQCWLSPIAIAMIKSLRLCSSQSIYAYYVFTPQGELIYQAFSVILLQLLRQKSQILRDKSQHDEFRAELYELQKFEHQDEEVNDTVNKRLSAFHKVALRVMSFFDESETVHVILDRLDRCCDLKRRVDHRKLLLKQLVKLVEAARCKLRILVVINGYQWSVEQRQDELEQKIKGRIIVHTAEQGDSA